MTSSVDFYFTFTHKHTHTRLHTHTLTRILKKRQYGVQAPPVNYWVFLLAMHWARKWHCSYCLIWCIMSCTLAIYKLRGIGCDGLFLGSITEKLACSFIWVSLDCVRHRPRVQQFCNYKLSNWAFRLRIQNLLPQPQVIGLQVVALSLLSNRFAMKIIQTRGDINHEPHKYAYGITSGDVQASASQPSDPH